MLHKYKSVKIISFILIILLLLLSSVARCTSDNKKGSSTKYFGDATITEENKILGEIILSLFPEEDRLNNVPIVAKDQKDSDLVFTLFNLDPEILESYAILTSKDNTSMNTIVIVASKLGYEVDVLMSLEHRIVNLLEGKEKEEQDKILENTVLEQYSLSKYLVLVLHDNSDLIYKEICEGLAELDSSKVDVIQEISGMIEITK